MKHLLTTLASIFILGNVIGQNYLHVLNNVGGEIAKLESLTGFPQLVFANNHGNLAQIGLQQTTNTGASSNDDLKLNTLTGFGKIKLEVGTPGTNEGGITINPTSSFGAYIGINTASPAAPLTVTNNQGGAAAEFRASVSDAAFVHFTGNGGTPINGYMGILNGATKDYEIGTTSTNNTGNLIFKTQNLESMWINPAGKVFIGSVAKFPSTVLTSNNSLLICGNAMASGYVASNGFVCASDNRFKKDVTPLSNPLDKVISLTGVTYFWDQDNFPNRGFDSDKQIGLIAQDVENILPELVTTDEEGYKSVDYVSLTAVLVEAIKEQQLTIAALEKKVDKITALENKLMALAAKD